MKGIAALLLVVFALAFTASAQIGSFENKYNAPEFSATLFGCAPGHHTKTCNDDYDVEKQSIPRDAGRAFVHYVQKFIDNDASLDIGYIDFPPNSTFDLDAAVSGVLAEFTSSVKELTNYHAGVVTHFNTSPRDVKELYPRFDTTVSGIPARGAAWQGMQVIDGDHTVTQYVRVFVKDNRLWEAFLYCSNGVACSDADARTFFNSIVIK